MVMTIRRESRVRFPTWWWQRLLWTFATVVVLLSGGRARAAAWEDADYQSISSGIEAPASIAVRLDGGTLIVGVRVAGVPGAKAAPSMTLGLAAAGKLILTEKDAALTTRDGQYQFVFTIPAEAVAKNEAEWARLRLAAAVSFGGGPNGQALYMVRYRHQDGRAVHSGFSKDSDVWEPFDLVGYQQQCADRRARVLIAFEQPRAGKGTIVIENAQGQRVRNLISGQPFAKGRQQVEWDLLNDEGQAVAPGQYVWRSLHHAGIVPEYQFSYANDGNPPWKTGSGQEMWGPDHSCITTVAALGERVYFLSPCAEAGYQGAVTDLRGVKQATWGTPTPVSKFLLASDGK